MQQFGPGTRALTLYPPLAPTQAVPLMVKATTNILTSSALGSSFRAAKVRAPRPPKMSKHPGVPKPVGTKARSVEKKPAGRRVGRDGGISSMVPTG